MPELIIPGLACVAYFEDTQQWHRIKVMNYVDEDHVKVNTVYRINFIMHSRIYTYIYK
jgi:hypothetical protein